MILPSLVADCKGEMFPCVFMGIENTLPELFQIIHNASFFCGSIWSAKDGIYGGGTITIEQDLIGQSSK